MKKLAFLKVASLFLLIFTQGAYAGPIFSGGGQFGEQVLVCQVKRGKFYSSFTISKTAKPNEFIGQYQDIKIVGDGIFAKLDCEQQPQQTEILFSCNERRAGEGQFTTKIYRTPQGLVASIGRKNLLNESNEIDRISCTLLN